MNGNIGYCKADEQATCMDVTRAPPVPLYEARRAATIPQWDFDGVDN